MMRSQFVHTERVHNFDGKGCGPKFALLLYLSLFCFFSVPTQWIEFIIRTHIEDTRKKLKQTKSQRQRALMKIRHKMRRRGKRHIERVYLGKRHRAQSRNTKRGKRIRLRWGSHSTFSPHSLGSRLSFFVGAWRSWWWWLAWQGRRAMDGWCRAFCLFTCITLWQNAWQTQTYFSSHALGPGVGLILLPRINFLTRPYIWALFMNPTQMPHIITMF